MAVYLKTEPSEELPFAENDLLRVPANREHLVAFPSQCAVIYTSVDNDGVFKVAFGVVAFVAVDLRSSDRGYTYKVKSGDEVFFAKEPELQYGPSCPLWLKTPGTDQEVAASVLKSYQPSPASEPQYALLETNSQKVHAGVLGNSLKFRKDGSQPPTMITADTRSTATESEEQVDAEGGQLVVVDRRKQGRAARPRELDTTDTRSAATESGEQVVDRRNQGRATRPRELDIGNERATSRTRISSPGDVQRMNNARRSSSSGRSGRMDNPARSHRTSCHDSPRHSMCAPPSSRGSAHEPKKSRQIAIPYWADFDRFSSTFILLTFSFCFQSLLTNITTGHLFGDRGEHCETLESQFGCRIDVQGPSRRHEDPLIRIEGSWQAIQEITKIVELEVVKSEDECDMFRMTFDLAIANRHYSETVGDAVYQRTPPHFDQKSWISIVTLPGDYTDDAKLFIGSFGSGVGAIKKNTGCEVFVENSSRHRAYVRIHGDTARAALECRDLVMNRLIWAGKKLRGNRRGRHNR
jgi:hypothetical protein